MTMPKKGTRQIVVGDTTYRYKVRRVGNNKWSPMTHSDMRVTVEVPQEEANPKYMTTTFEEVVSVTPKDVENYIRKELLSGLD